MLLADTPSATASQLLDLYLSLHGFGLVGPDDVRELGLEPEQLRDLERRIPVAWVLHLWQRAASRGARPEIGLLVGQQRGLHTRGPVAHLAAQSATLGEAIELFRRYIPVMSEGESLRVEPIGKRVRIHFLLNAPLLGHAVACEHSLSSALCWARQLTGVRLVPQAVGFRHAAQAAPAVYRQVFGVPARFAEAFDYLELLESDLLLPVPGANAYLKGLMQQRVSDMQAQLPAQHSARLQVLQLIERSLPSGELSVEAAARGLGISRQTLHRRLRSEDCSFSGLLAEVRQRYALQRLAQPGCTIEQLSRELGFSEPSAFYKAFKGWFGVTPKGYAAS
ncbi:AraC family transcriptional regulator ligand-binding domain-containing protein [Pseudomonas sp. PDM14]|uniref:AraC family transcriptional regulator n=1 Tax=Pseudomonas sp. PDM14 TaxID=2769288 RepID=UPI00177F1586|nr:AraC family transcriptional regulator [Pseudomonas sp. PDM14]MBD9485311.1 AraC family transcriptional regulator ligand-binding domain-containing protein [Pseudomonas sp. PDM14]